jgi:hypothetical protein
MLRTNICESLWLFECEVNVGQLNTMGNDQPALRALFACESGLSEPEIGLEHAFVLLIWQKKHDKWVKWQNSSMSSTFEFTIIVNS